MAALHSPNTSIVDNNALMRFRGDVELAATVLNCTVAKRKLLVVLLI
jgi:hypothetical protein